MEKQITKLLTIKDVQSMVGVSSEATIYNYMNSGLLPFRQVGRKRRFTLDDINKFLENCKPAKTPHKKP